MAYSQQDKNGYQLRSGIFVLPEQDEKFDRLLSSLLHSLPAKFIMLTDVAGQVVLARGEHDASDLVMLGSLVAGDLAASQEIARMMGEYQDYQIILREGQRSHTFIAEAGHYLAMLVQVDKETPLGWARMLIIKAAQQLAEVMVEPAPAAAEIEEIRQEATLALHETQDSLADLFGDALDGMWSE